MAPVDMGDARVWIASYGDPELADGYLSWLADNPTAAGDHWQTYPQYLAEVQQPAESRVNWPDAVGTAALWVGGVGTICYLMVERWS